MHADCLQIIKVISVTLMHGGSGLCDGDIARCSKLSNSVEGSSLNQHSLGREEGVESTV